MKRWTKNEEVMLKEMKRVGNTYQECSVTLSEVFGNNRTSMACRKKLLKLDPSRKIVDLKIKRMHKHKRVLYSKKEIALINKLRIEQGKSWVKIAAIISKKMGIKRTPNSLAVSHSNRLGQALLDESRKEAEAAAVVKISFEAGLKQKVLPQAAMPTESERLYRQGGHWTKEEDIKLLMVWKGASVDFIRKEMGRGYGVCAVRYERLILNEISNRLDVAEIAMNRLKIKEWESKKLNRVFLYIRTKKQNRLKKKIAKLNKKVKTYA
jgi:hypothetical protein